MMNLAMAFERTDEVVLPAVYSFVAASFGANLLQLSYLTLARALTQALLSPLGGWLGHAFNRVAVLSVGCLVWGAAMGAFALSTTLGQGIACWAVTGAGLCIVVPNAQSLTADLHEESRRGAAFGTLHLTSALGAALGGLYATNVGALRPLGWDGWRVAMALLGLAALGIGALNAAVSADPRALPGSRWRLAPEEHEEEEEESEGGVLSSSPPPLPLELLLGGEEAGAGVAARSAAGGGRGGRGAAAAEEEAVALTASAFGDDFGGASASSSITPFAVAPKGRAAAAAGIGGAGAAGAAALPASAALSSPSSSSPLSPSPSSTKSSPTFLSDFLSVLRVPTFVIIVAQGIVGNVPMAALAFQTLYLQLLGVPAAWASAAVSAGFGAHALGGLLGGALGDAAARWSPRHGRVLVCQASVVLGALATLLMLRGLPRGYYQVRTLPPPPPPPPPPEMKSRAAAAVPAYLAVFILGGLVNAWPAPACNNPIFAEIVPARSRTLVYAFDRSFEMVRFFLMRRRRVLFCVLFLAARARGEKFVFLFRVILSSLPTHNSIHHQTTYILKKGRRRPRRRAPRLPRRDEALRLLRRRGRRERRPSAGRPQGRGALRGPCGLDCRAVGGLRSAVQWGALHLREGQGARGGAAGGREEAAAGERRRRWAPRPSDRQRRCRRRRRRRLLAPLPAAAPAVGLDRREARGLRCGRRCGLREGRGRRGRRVVVAAERGREEERRSRRRRQRLKAGLTFFFFFFQIH